MGEINEWDTHEHMVCKYSKASVLKPLSHAIYNQLVGPPHFEYSLCRCRLVRKSAYVEHVWLGVWVCVCVWAATSHFFVCESTCTIWVFFLHAPFKTKLTHKEVVVATLSIACQNSLCVIRFKFTLIPYVFRMRVYVLCIIYFLQLYHYRATIIHTHSHAQRAVQWRTCVQTFARAWTYTHYTRFQIHMWPFCPCLCVVCFDHLAQRNSVQPPTTFVSN